MVLSGEEKVQDAKVYKVFVECECGTHLIEFLGFEDDTEAYINFYTDNFYGKQKENIFKRIYTKLKRIWYIMRDRQYVFEEIVIAQKDIDEIIKGLQQIKIQEVKK